MTTAVVFGALLNCSCGLLPSALLTRSRVVRHSIGLDLATIEDCRPLVNIPPFGACTAPGNPSLLPQKPCLPQLTAPWSANVPGVLAEGVPVLSADAVLPCLYGGVIVISLAGQSGCFYTSGSPNVKKGEP